MSSVLNVQVNPFTKIQTYTNPVLNQDFADPTVIKGGDGFYHAYGTNSNVNGKMVNIQVVKIKLLTRMAGQK
jgi:arabinan endo-1,5-alpha-L-arabinosidase